MWGLPSQHVFSFIWLINMASYHDSLCNIKPIGERGPLEIKFSVESSSSLWSVVFTGFDESAILKSEFRGASKNAVDVLHRFGGILKGKGEGLRVEFFESGISIAKTHTLKDKKGMEAWISLMERIKEEIASMLDE